MAKEQSAVRTFMIPRPGGAPDLPIHITEPDLRAKGLALETWAASSVQAKLIQHLPDGDVVFPAAAAAAADPAVLPVLELGAGTGMVGLSACARWRQTTVLTDLGPIAPGLAANIALNRGDGGALAGVVDDDAGSGEPRMLCGTLDWADPASLSLYQDQKQQQQQQQQQQGQNNNSTSTSGGGGGQERKEGEEEGEEEGEREVAAALAASPTWTRAHVVLAADVIYCEEHPPLLTGAVARWLRRDDPRARLVMCLPLRVCYLEELRDLWARLGAAGLECVADGQESADSARFDDECLCEWSVWRWREDRLLLGGGGGGGGGDGGVGSRDSKHAASG